MRRRAAAAQQGADVCPVPTPTPPPSATVLPLPWAVITDYTSPPLPPLSPQTRSEELRRQCPNKSAGPDRVCPRMLKACAVELGMPLQHVFNLSL
ncbi:hypothetical protein LDENG_00208960 [Lucifuga dentata]|nr:hypothetical protein LDENG_00208960 [Lucifuga dentata]